MRVTAILRSALQRLKDIILYIHRMILYISEKIRMVFTVLSHWFMHFSWTLRTPRRWRWFHKRADIQQISEMAKAVTDRNLDRYKLLIVEFVSRRQFESAVLELNFDQSSNEEGERVESSKTLLEEILTMPKNDANSFYEATRKNISDQSFYYLLKTSKIPKYVENNSELLLRILDDCEYIVTGITTFCSVRGDNDETILHAAAERNPSLFVQLLNRLDYSAGCNITIDFYMVIIFLNLGPNLLVGTEGPLHWLCLAIQVTTYCLYYHLHYYNVIWFLCQKAKGRSVFTAASRNKEAWQLCVDLMNTYTRRSLDSLLTSFYKNAERDFERTREYFSGLIIASAFLFIIHYLVIASGNLIVHITDEAFNRFLRNSATILLLAALLYKELVPKAFTFIGLFMRFVTHLVFIPRQGAVVSFGLISSDLTHVILIALFWRILSRRLIKQELFQEDQAQNNKFFLVQACPAVKIHVLENLDSEGFMYRETKKVFDKIPDVYVRLGSDAELAEVGEDDRRKIKGLLRRKRKKTHAHIVNDTSRVHVVIAYERDDELTTSDRMREIESLKAMCSTMHYTLQLVLGVFDGEVLKEKLPKVLKGIQNCEVVLIFLMGHGKDERTFGKNGSSIHLSQVIGIVEENTSKDVFKCLYIQTCRITSEQERAAAAVGLRDTDSVPEASLPEAPLKPWLAENQPEELVDRPLTMRERVETCNKMLVHTAAKKGEYAVRETFIMVAAEELQSTVELFITVQEASSEINSRVESFSTAQVTPSPDYHWPRIRVPIPNS